MRQGLIISEEGKAWYLNDKLHREDGPAIEAVDGTKYWIINGRFHREDGPAMEDSDGSKEWYYNGVPHRMDGPAMELANGFRGWFYHGKRIHCKTKEEFDRLIKLKVFW